MPFMATSETLDVDVKVDAGARPVCSKRSVIFAFASTVEVVERMLIERRRGVTAVGCDDGFSSLLPKPSC